MKRLEVVSLSGHQLMGLDICEALAVQLLALV